MNPDVRLKRSPFFYVGDKFKLIAEIRKHFPEKINTFVEPFLGGGSVFLNVDAKHYVLNDIDENVIALHKFLTSQASKEKALVTRIKDLVEQYNLSCSVFENVVPIELKKKWPKTYYAEFNRKGYGLLKSDYNTSKKKDLLVLFLLLIYGFNRMLRFNRKGEFNIPVGNVDFNQNVLKALQDYFVTAREKEVSFSAQDFKKFLTSQKFSKNDFVYVDPPYLISASEYNKLWNEELDGELMQILDRLNDKGIRFALSNISAYNGRKNEKLISWMKKYNVYPIKSNYISYHNNTKKEITEVLITNY
ncbi:Dam family site-specific DNA-(adenine-N6)-methyltransferase [Candidatus Parcubacteria bacterium]|nr:Dam family site-specific DNA-(adenine-N6)-methyltransferase [Candidatus Parcubacteria bacterium]